MKATLLTLHAGQTGKLYFNLTAHEGEPTTLVGALAVKGKAVYMDTSVPGQVYIPPVAVGCWPYEIRCAGVTVLHGELEVAPSPLGEQSGEVVWHVDADLTQPLEVVNIIQNPGPAGRDGKSPYVQDGRLYYFDDTTGEWRDGGEVQGAPGKDGEAPTAEDVAAALLPMIGAEFTYEGPAAANNWHASYFQLGENYLPEGTALTELGYRVRFDSIAGCTTDPVYLGVWERAENGEEWELRGVSLNTQTQAQSVDVMWQFDSSKVRLHGRPIRCCLLATREDGWRTDLTMGVRVSDVTAANTFIFLNEQSWAKAPKFFLKGYKPVDVNMSGGSGLQLADGYDPTDETKAISGRVLAKALESYTPSGGGGGGGENCACPPGHADGGVIKIGQDVCKSEPPYAINIALDEVVGEGGTLARLEFAVRYKEESGMDNILLQGVKLLSAARNADSTVVYTVSPNVFMTEDKLTLTFSPPLQWEKGQALAFPLPSSTTIERTNERTGFYEEDSGKYFRDLRPNCTLYTSDEAVQAAEECLCRKWADNRPVEETWSDYYRKASYGPGLITNIRNYGLSEKKEYVQCDEIWILLGDLIPMPLMGVTLYAEAATDHQYHFFQFVSNIRAYITNAEPENSGYRQPQYNYKPVRIYAHSNYRAGTIDILLAEALEEDTDPSYLVLTNFRDSTDKDGGWLRKAIGLDSRQREGVKAYTNGLSIGSSGTDNGRKIDPPMMTFYGGGLSIANRLASN